MWLDDDCILLFTAALILLCVMVLYLVTSNYVVYVFMLLVVWCICVSSHLLHSNCLLSNMMNEYLELEMLQNNYCAPTYSPLHIKDYQAVCMFLYINVSILSGQIIYQIQCTPCNCSSDINLLISIVLGTKTLTKMHFSKICFILVVNTKMNVLLWYWNPPTMETFSKPFL